MVANAKQFNERDSAIWSDAEKIRKIVSNFMMERNPGYKDRGYQVLPTPIPESTGTQTRRVIKGPARYDDTPTGKGVQRKASRLVLQPPAPVATPQAAVPRKSGTGPSSAVPARKGKVKAAVKTKPLKYKINSTLKGKSLQEAQEAIVAEMIDLKDEE